MRIALYHNLPSGGAKRAVYEWTRRLVADHQVDVFSLGTADHDFCDIRPLVNKHLVFEFEPRRLLHSPFGRLNQLQRWRDLEKLTELGRQTAQKINDGRYDVVFAHTCQYTFIPPLLPFVEAPSAYYLHEPFGWKFTRPIRRPYIASNGWRASVDRYDPLIKLLRSRLVGLQNKSVKHTTRLLANSRYTREHMRRSFGVDAPICHYGVDSESFYPMPGIAKEDFVLSVGELSPRKGFDFVVESLGHIPMDRRPPLILACNMVKSAEKSYIMALASEHGVQLQVLTHLQTSELCRLYNRARLCVYAPVQEPFGLVPLESMACATPVVGVREGGVQESVVHEQTGLLVERDSARFAEAIEHILFDLGLARRYGQNAREIVLESWTWDQSVVRLEEHLLAVSEIQAPEAAR